MSIISKRMIRYKEYSPSIKFRDIISCFWTMGYESNVSLPARDIVLPDGCVDLLINSGRYFPRIDHHSKREFEVKDYALVGQRQHSIGVTPSVETDFFAIRFTPFGMQALLPFDSSEITGDMLEECAILKGLIDPIRMILEKKISIEEKIHLIEQDIDSQIRPDFIIKPIVAHATHEIIKHQGDFNVKSFCLRHDIHKSTLEKSFLAQVGLRPKEFAAIVRFNHTHSMLKAGHYESLTQLALNCGYYDQSHMIKDFKRFSNHSPSKFLKAKHLLPEIAVSCYNSLQA